MFKFGNYTFKPNGKLKKIDSICELILRTDRNLRIWDKQSEQFFNLPASKLYSHKSFYEAMGNSEDDLFLCIENGKTYLPCEHELFQFEGYR